MVNLVKFISSINENISTIQFLIEFKWCECLAEAVRVMKS